MLPLDGFRVLDLTRFLSGPYATMVLAELGADVIKVEQPHVGDDTRRFEPKVGGESYPGAMPNRSKRSLSLDLKSDRGRELFLRLAEDADLVMENFRAGTARKLGVDYEAVKDVRPDIIYCSISGFGQTGPYRHRPGFDIMAQGVCGFLRMTGNGDRPAKVGVAINDLAAGATAIYSVLGAQMLRNRTGQGQYIDISLVDAGLAWTIWESGAFFANGEIPEATGTRHRRSTPYQAYRTSDGFVTIGAGNDRLWAHFCEALAKPEWLKDPRFLTLHDRMSNIDELERGIEEVTCTRTTGHWIRVLDAAGVPCGPVLRYDETWADPQVIARDMVVEMSHPIMGDMKTVAPPVKFSDLDFSVRRAAPWLGQHSAEVLREFGVDDETITELFEQGVLFDAHPTLHEPHADAQKFGGERP